MKPKAIIFDCFGVVASRVLGGWVPDNLGKDFDSNGIFDQIDIGEVSEDDALTKFANLVSRPKDIVRKEIDSYFKPITGTVEIIKELRVKGYKIILLTNSSHSFFERFVFTEHPWFKELFDDIIISSIIKMIKPNKDIFIFALNKHNLKPEEAIFIDDSKGNIEGAEKVGIPSILFKSPGQLKEDLAKLILL